MTTNGLINLQISDSFGQYSMYSDSNPYRIELLNFSMGFSIIAPYMDMLNINRYLHH